jgi:hypothetical protein
MKFKIPFFKSKNIYQVDYEYDLEFEGDSLTGERSMIFKAPIKFNKFTECEKYDSVHQLILEYICNKYDVDIDNIKITIQKLLKIT